jgi:two-component system, cell cycle sensor histidine kinase and response regulator CckA
MYTLYSYDRILIGLLSKLQKIIVWKSNRWVLLNLPIESDLGANAFLPSPVEKSLFIEHVQKLLAGETPKKVTCALIADSSKSVVALLAKTFETYGYRVHSAYNGNEALELFQEVIPEIVMLDYHLQDANDGRLIEAFHKTNPGCAVIVITSDPKPELALHVMKLGARAYARKPFDPKYLISLCENARRELSLLHAEALLEERTWELRESEERYRRILNSMEEAYYIK